MPLAQTLLSKIQYRIKRRRYSVYMPKDFCDLSDSDQIGRALRTLVAKGLLVRLGQGVYARTKRSSITQELIPEKSLPLLGVEIAKKLGLRVVPSSYELAYNQGKITQVPTGRVIGIRGGRISRKIGYKGVSIKYEQSPKF